MLSIKYKRNELKFDILEDTRTASADIDCIKTAIN